MFDDNIDRIVVTANVARVVYSDNLIDIRSSWLYQRGQYFKITRLKCIITFDYVLKLWYRIILRVLTYERMEQIEGES